AAMVTPAAVVPFAMPSALSVAPGDDVRSNRLEAVRGYCLKAITTNLRLQHPHLLRIREQPAGRDDGCDFAQRLERPLLARALIKQNARIDVNDEIVASADALA